MSLITTTQDLNDFCQQLARSDYITVDTEFLRESTYWPKLCLVQMASREQDAAIDALAEAIDLTALFDLLKNKSVLKVFHSARQDLEIFYHLMGELPSPIFDTQVAAMVCGFGDSIGYDNLARRLISVEIDKSARFTDWTRRPLTEKQIHYALSDVTWLRDIYEKLAQQITKAKRHHWLDEEMAILESPDTYDSDPREIYKKMKTRSNNRQYLAILRELAAWREIEAKTRNTPRSRVLKDEQLFDIASQSPKSAKELAKTRGISMDFAQGRLGKGILESITKALSIPPDERPLPKERIEVPPGMPAIVDLLKILLKHRCEQFNVAQKLICNSQDLEKIAINKDVKETPAMKGWRYEVFGEAAEKLKDGKIAFRIKNGELLIESPR